MTDYDRIRIRYRKAKTGNSYEVVKETHKAGHWDDTPEKIEIIDQGLTLSEAKERAQKEKDKPDPPPKDPYEDIGWF